MRLKYGLTVLYFDGLSEIVNLVESENGRTKVTLNDNKHEYVFNGSSDIAEINMLPQQVFHNAKIESHGDIHICIELCKHSASVYISEDNVKGRGILVKTNSIIKPTNMYITWFLISPVLSVSLMFLSIRLFSRNNYILFAITLICSLVLFVGSAMLSFSNYSTVYTKSKKDTPSFFIRKKDELILAFISVSFGAILGAIVTYLLKR